MVKRGFTRLKSIHSEVNAPVKRGFTLIELLVVIAIIGVLSAIILAAVNVGRTKGNDVTVKANIDAIRSQSVLFYDTNGGYATSSSMAATGVPVTQSYCTTASTVFTDPNVVKMLSAADKATAGAGVGPPPTNVKCAINSYANNANWVIYAPLVNNTGSNTGWCLDSTGIEKADVIPTGYSCP
jgi:prepilin-type N-terminal cleavage/methylation domain-containing protein